MRAPGTPLSAGEETENPKGGPTFLSSCILGFYASAVTSERVPRLGVGAGGYTRQRDKRPPRKQWRQGLWARKLKVAWAPPRTHIGTDMEQRAKPQCDLYPEGLGSRVPGPAGPHQMAQDPSAGEWGYSPTPRVFRATLHLGAMPEQGLPASTPPHSLSPWKRPTASPGRGEITGRCDVQNASRVSSSNVRQKFKIFSIYLSNTLHLSPMLLTQGCRL